MNERLASPVPARLRLLAGTVLSAACAPAGANPVTAGTGAILPVLGGVVLLCALVVGWLAWRRWRPARVEEAGPGARDPKCLQALFAATDDPFQPAPEVLAALAAALPPYWAELPDVSVRIDFDGQAYGAAADAASAAAP